jgi:anaerobic nitric oxide reductase transcription regulator
MIRNVEGAVGSTTSLPDSQQLDVLLEIARDLTSSLAAHDRYGRLLAAVRRAIPCDAACLLVLEGDQLVPVAAHGLTPEALTRRFPRRDHPRLDVILRSPEPVRFPPDSALPDPFDGLLAADPQGQIHIHACLGSALHEGGEVVGALTADALAPNAFDHLEPSFLAALGALAGAALRTTTLIEALERRAEHRGRVARELQRSASSIQIVGDSAAARRLLEEVALVSRSDLSVLVTGETGVGKELVAQHIHSLSARRDEALIQVNCAALPESIAESELFGHVAGAFTGARGDRAGKFEVADGGTLFLDEVGELPLSLQPKLLRALQQGEIQRVGSDRVHRVDVRVIAATNRDLQAEVQRGRFRADLYHRLAVFPLRVPSLRERREDIPVLAVHFMDVARRRLGAPPVRIAEQAQERLAGAEWPGNVRELENVISRAVLRATFRQPGATSVVVTLRDLDLGDGGEAPAAEPNPPAVEASGAPRPLRDRVDDFQREAIRAALARHEGNWAAAARELGLHRSNLHHLARRLALR